MQKIITLTTIDDKVKSASNQTSTALFHILLAINCNLQPSLTQVKS